MRMLLKGLAWAGAGVGVMFAHSALATIAVGPGCTLANAINYANSLNPNASYTPFYGPTGNGSCTGGASGANTIVLPAGTITFTGADNNWYGPNALPPVWSTITIEGNATTSSALLATHTGDPTPTAANAFRFFYVSGGLAGELPAGNLTLHNLTLVGGVIKGGDGGHQGGGGAGMGGAIFNQGTLTLRAVTLRANAARGGDGGTGGPGTNGGGGGMGQDASVSGGGFGGSWSGTYGGAGGIGSSSGNPGAGGGGGFLTSGSGQDGAGGGGGCGGGQSRLGDAGGLADGGCGGIGAAGSVGGNGGRFGNGGGAGSANGGGGGGGVGGGGAAANAPPFAYGGGGGFGGGAGAGSNYGAGFGGGGAGGPTLSGFGGGAGSGGAGGGGGGAGMGGAIFNHRGTLTLINVTATQNLAYGGGRAQTPGSGFASGLGSAVFNLNGSVTIRFSTLSGNATDSHNGVPLSDGAVYSIAFGNTIETGLATSAILTIENSIAYSNGSSGLHDVVTAAYNGTQTNSSVLNYVGANLIKSTSGTASAGSTTPSTQDPQLIMLENWGGPTQTMPPALGSPAVDAVSSCANSGLVDQRGFLRPEGAQCDIGAVEVLQDELLTVSVSTGGAVSADAAPTPTSGGIVNCTNAGGAACTAHYFNVPSVPLYATAQAGYVFDHWGGDCTTAGSPHFGTATIHNPTPACTATFVPMSMSASAPSVVYGNDIVLTANLSSPVPLIGSAVFKETSPTSTTLCSNVALTDLGSGNFKATCTVTTPTAGVHAVQVDYTGNGTATATTPFTVTQASTVSNLSLSPQGPIALGSSVTATVALSVVAPGAGNPTGTITVNDSTGGLCTISPPATSCTLTPVTVGEKSIAASYGGDNNFIGGVSNAVSLSVAPPPRLVTASSNGFGSVSPTSQYVANGNSAPIVLTPTPGYTPTTFGGTCPPGLLSGNVYITAPVSANCSISVTFGVETLSLSVTDYHTYARYGGSVIYAITLTNPGTTAVSGVSISGTAPSGLNLAGSRWQCLGSGCTQNGSGPFADSGVTVPAASSLYWVVTVPVLSNAPGATIDYVVSVTGGGVAPQTDSDLLVLFHDSFDVQNGDGAQ